MSANVPPAFKPIAHYIKIANENASRDPVIYYWCLFYAVQSAMKLDKTSPDALKYLTGLLGTLEAIKKQLHDNEAIINETVAQAHIENFALKLFNFADGKEKAGNIDKAVVHAFYTAGHVMDILSLFGEVDEPFASSKKYAKWKSTQIFACLRDGTPYVPSSQQEEEKNDDDDLAAFGEQFQPASSSSGGVNPQEHQYPSQPPPAYGFGGLPLAPPQLPAPAPRTTSYQPPVAPPRDASPFSAPSHNPYPAAPQQPSSSDYSSYGSGGGSGGQPTAEDFAEIRKLCKYALSAVDYEDTKAIRDNLMKALKMIEKY